MRLLIHSIGDFPHQIAREHDKEPADHLVGKLAPTPTAATLARLMPQMRAMVSTTMPNTMTRAMRI